jgi:hypothetical protein
MYSQTYKWTYSQLKVIFKNYKNLKVRLHFVSRIR